MKKKVTQNGRTPLTAVEKQCGVKCPACDGEGEICILPEDNIYNKCGICEGKRILTKEELEGYKAFFKEGI